MSIVVTVKGSTIAIWQFRIMGFVVQRLTVVTVLVLGPTDGAIWLHLQVKALLAEQSCHNAFQLWFCNTGNTHRGHIRLHPAMTSQRYTLVPPLRRYKHSVVHVFMSGACHSLIKRQSGSLSTCAAPQCELARKWADLWTVRR